MKNQNLKKVFKSAKDLNIKLSLKGKKLVSLKKLKKISILAKFNDIQSPRY